MSELRRGKGVTPRRRRPATAVTSHRITATGSVASVVLVGLLAAMAWTGWQFLGSNLGARRETQRATQALRQSWTTVPAGASSSGAASASTPSASTPSSSTPAQAVALLRVPSLGPAAEWPVWVGTSSQALDRGVGWYDGSAAPGEVGNFAVAGRRIGQGEPFRHLLELRKGSQVIVETRSHLYTYALDNAPVDLTVSATDGWVLEPVPGSPARTPTRSVITLTTSQDLLASADRSVAFGHLVGSTRK